MRCENFALYRNKRLLRAVVALLQKNLLMLLAVRISSYGCTWEVWRVLKKLELRSVAPRATLTHFPCPPNFPRVSITRYTYAKHEQILNLPCACHMLVSRMYRAYILLALCPSMHACQENAETTPVPLSKSKFHCG